MEGKRIKKGFSLELETKPSIENYVVYFEEKQYVSSTGRNYQKNIVFCYIQDSFLEGYTFKAKAVCHKDDVYSLKEGRDIAFHRALEKRDIAYKRMLLILTRDISNAMKHNVNIERKFNSFNRKN